jgi:hypothetical protein
MQELNVMEEKNVLYFDVLKEKRPKDLYIKKKLQSSRVSIAISKFGDFNHIGG